ncbi:MAG: hypothetical protein J0I41_13335, partial [Filimonas sp.]|nr:hypothetical protein [Filimonas sp.]
FRRSVTCNGITRVTNIISIYVYAPFIAGKASPSIIYANYYDYSDTVRVSVPPTGGAPTFTYSWYTSTNGTAWAEKQRGGDFIPQFDRNGYIKCRFASNGVYVESNTIKVLYPVNPGYITTIDSWVKDSTTTLSIISGAAASNGIDTTTTDYNYTYQKSYDQVNWTNLPGASISNIDKTTFVRRKVQHGFETAYSNVMTVYRLGFTPSYYWPNGAAAPANGTQPVVPMPTYTGITNIENLNYVKTRDFIKPGVTDITTADAQAGVYDVRQVTAYFDGLGRPMQTVAQQASPLQKDLVTTNFYDVFGREAQQYLPYVDSVNTDGKFKTDPSGKQLAFYDKMLAGKESYYYTNNVYEASPLNTILRSTPAGKSWTGRDIGVQQLYRTNTVNDLVRMWNIVNDTSLPVGTQYYPVGKLFLRETLDENGNKTIECKDYAGKLVAKMTHPTIYTNVNVTNWLYTYYVYDALENLRYVIAPKAVTYLNSNSWTLNRAVVDELCFQYRYDKRNRMITKKVPGAGIVNIVYDARDRQVMMQDSLMKSKGQWNVTVYDDLNRPVQTGLWNNATDAVTHRQNAYNSSSYPMLDNNYTLLTETFYDDYSWRSRSDINLSARDFTNKFNNTADLPVIQDNAYSLVPTVSIQTKGLVTGIRVRVLDTTFANTYLTRISWYDDHSRPIQVQSQNITGGWDTVTTRYDFAGKILSISEAHATSADVADIKFNKISTAYLYDHGDRVLKVTKFLDGNSASETLLVKKYDELGRLNSKILGEQKLDSLIYDYNIRGWLKGINADYVRSNATNHWFGMNLSYDYGQVRPQLNGNISANEWKTKGDGVVRGYGYLYDNVNRLTTAHYGQYNGTNYVVDPVIDFMVDSLAYDANGNILNMRQKGLVVNTSPYIDRLGYTYQGTTWTNKLAKVKDNSTVQAKLGDFKDGTNTGDDYAYDGNGNMTSDANKNISNIAYNHLNLPQQITVDGKGKITYIYDAAGNKLKKITQDDSTQTKTVTTYIGAYVYKNDTLQFIGQEEGRIRPTKKDQVLAYNYDYFIKDHLGNVRMVLTEERQQDVYPVATLETSGLATEKSYYNIDENQIVGKDSLSAFRAAASSNYPNNNGNPPYNNNPAMGNDVTAESQRLYKLNGANGQKLGLGITLKVMSGDTVSILGKSFFHLDQGQKSNNTAKLLFDNIINSMFGGGGFVGADKGATAALLNGSTATTTPLTSWLNSQTVPPDSIPKAYINWILLDEQFRLVTQGAGFDPVGSNDVIKSHLRSVTIPKNGYLYVYCSNESNINVFFDNLQVIHARGPLLDESHYYPFGLTMAGISSKAAGKLENKEKANAGSELQNREFSDGSGLELYDAVFRMYDAQIGRFMQVDPLADVVPDETPFSFVRNNPVQFTDPLGLLTDSTKTPGFVNSTTGANDLQSVSVTGVRTKNLNLFSVPLVPPGDLPFARPISVAGVPALPLTPYLLRPITGPPTPVVPIGGASAVAEEATVARTAVAANPILLTILGVFIPTSTGPGASRVPHPWYSPNFKPWPGHGNSRDNSNPHIVYQFTFQATDGKTPVLKIGIADFYGWGFDRPESQEAALKAEWGASVKWRTIQTVTDRSAALFFEKLYLSQHVARWGEFPREQHLPSKAPSSVLPF